MFHLLFKVILISFLFTLDIQSASADCWNISRKDGSVLHTPVIWHIRNKLVDDPQGVLMGKMDDTTKMIATNQIDSVIIEARDTGWLGTESYNAKITFRNGQHMSLTMTQSLHYQKDSDHNGDLPLADIERISHCIAAAIPAKVTDKTVSVTTIDNSILTIHLKNGDTVRGKLAADINWQSAYGILKIKSSLVEQLNYDTSKSSGIMMLKSGDHIIGKPTDNTLTIHLSIGQDINIPLRDIQIIASPSTQIK